MTSKSNLLTFFRSLDDFKVIADDEEEVYFMGEDDYSNGHYKKPESDYTGELDY